MGTHRRAKSPNTVDAHRGFRVVYILLANNYREMGLAGDKFRVRSRGLSYWESSTKDTVGKGLV